MEKTEIPQMLDIMKIRHNSRSRLMHFIYYHLPPENTDRFLADLSKTIEQEKKRAVQAYKKSLSI